MVVLISVHLNGTNIIAVHSGKVVSAKFSGPNGYTVSIESGNYLYNYSHVSPIFLVYVGEYISQGQIIAKVGPKNVYGILNNPYKDSNGNPTNGATTRSTFTFFNKKRRQSRQSIRLLLKTTCLHLQFHIVSNHDCNHDVLHNRNHLPNQVQ